MVRFCMQAQHEREKGKGIGGEDGVCLCLWFVYWVVEFCLLRIERKESKGKDRWCICGLFVSMVCLLGFRVLFVKRPTSAREKKERERIIGEYVVSL